MERTRILTRHDKCGCAKSSVVGPQGFEPLTSQYVARNHQSAGIELGPKPISESTSCTTTSRSFVEPLEEFGHSNAQFPGALEPFLVLLDVALLVCSAHSTAQPESRAGDNHSLVVEEFHDLD